MGLLKITFETLLRRSTSRSAYAPPIISHKQLSTSNTAGHYVSAFSPPPRTNEPSNPKTVFQLNYCKFQSSMQLGAEVLAEKTYKLQEKYRDGSSYCWTDYYFLFFEKGWGQDVYVRGEIDEELQYLCRQPYRDFWSFEVLLKFARYCHAKLPYHIWDKFEALELKFRILDHEETHLIIDELYCDFYKRSCILLLEIDQPLTEIIKFEPCFVKPVNSSIKGENPDFKEFKKSGDEALEQKKFEEAVKFYTDALINCGDLNNSCVSNDELVRLYSNRSAAYRELGDIKSAEKNTEVANYFSKLEFKVHPNQKEVFENIKKLRLLHERDKFDLNYYFRSDYFEKGIFSPRQRPTY